MTDFDATSILWEFLADHPEHLPNVRQAPVSVLGETGPGTTPLMNTEALITFADWTIRTGRGDAAKARAFREQLRERLGR